MPNESGKQKPSALSKIVAILDKLKLDEATDTWRLSGDWLHQKIDKHRDELTSLQKLTKKDNE